MSPFKELRPLKWPSLKIARSTIQQVWSWFERSSVKIKRSSIKFNRSTIKSSPFEFSPFNLPLVKLPSVKTPPADVLLSLPLSVDNEVVLDRAQIINNMVVIDVSRSLK
jgi:hypothetical protein